MKNKKEKKADEMFTKEQIINSKMYIKNRDILIAILKEDKAYTKEEVELRINEFLKRRL